MEVVTHSAAETESLAQRLGGNLSGGMLVLLSGELGAGKTVFVRGLARGLGMPPGVAVTSPTYVLLHKYTGGRLTLYHIDAYRMRGGADEFEASGLSECFDDREGIVCLEWPERLGNMALPNERIVVAIDHLDPSIRRLNFSAFGDRAVAAINTFS